MKFIVSSGNLLKKLGSIGGLIGPSPSTPIIEQIRLHIKNEVLEATATDGQSTMVVTVPVQSTEEAIVCVDPKLVLGYLKTLSEQPLTFDVNTKDYGIVITSDEGKYRMPGENAIAYPGLPKIEDAVQFSIPSSRFLTGISNTIFAVGNDEMRQAMTGVFMEMTKKSITFVATDAHRLVRYMITGIDCNGEEGIIVPKKPLAQLKGLLLADDSALQVAYNKKFIYVENDNMKLYSTLINGKYPDYKVVIPRENPYTLTANKEELLNALRRVLVFANKTTNQVVLKINNGELRIDAQDVDFSLEGHESMACQFTGDEMDISFNGKFLLELLSNLNSEEVLVELSTSSRAGIYKPSHNADDEDLLMLLMPLMLNSN
jgi:DNA polymerase III subunit beta